MIRFRFLIFVSSLFLPFVALKALEIPLERKAGNSKKVVVIGFIDMERVYQEFPETRKARQEYQEKASQIRQKLVDKDAELSDLREQLLILKEALEADAVSPPVPLSTGTVSSLPTGPSQMGDLTRRESMLAEQETSLAKDKEEAVKILSEFENKRSAEILGKLYKSLVQLSEERGVDIVLDKKILVFGQEGMDLTNDLSRRVRGLPDEEKQ